jgi:hypothetical protein
MNNLGVLLLGLLLLKNLASAQSTNATNVIKSTAAAAKATNPAPFVFDLLENENGKCLVQYKEKTLTVTIKNAPKTLFAEHRSFAREDAYVTQQKVKFIQWNARISAAEGAFSSGHTGTAEAVDRTLQMRANIAAERAQYNAQVEIFNLYQQRLAENKQKDRNNEPYHHPRRCKGLFVRMGADGTPEWTIVAIY